jgi:hypothetical protein
MNLLEWTSRYIDHLNSFKQNVISKDIKGKMILCKYKDGPHLFIIEEIILDKVIEKIKEGSITLVCLNKKENIAFIINNWTSLKNPKLKIMFVNPNLNLHWSFIPVVHKKIADPQSLKLGLKSMYESIPEVNQ